MKKRENCLQTANGDAIQIARITGYSHSYVRMVLCGARNNDKIIQVARKIIAAREQIILEERRA